jgi:hypothetical protein
VAWTDTEKRRRNVAGKMGKQGVGRFMDLPMTIGFQAYRGSNPLTNGHTLKYLDRLTWETRDLYTSMD